MGDEEMAVVLRLQENVKCSKIAPDWPDVRKAGERLSNGNNKKAMCRENPGREESNMMNKMFHGEDRLALGDECLSQHVLIL